MLLKEQEDGTTRLSVRTRPGGVDATVLTGTFGGGGHARAAGALGAAAPRRGDRAGARGGGAAGRRGAPVSRRDRSGGLDGVLVVAKPSGPTSHDVVDLVRRLSSTRRVGHGGTLDPFAAGVLPLFLGRATRLAEYHLAGTKRYRATICFGETSTTDDIDGTRTPGDGPAPSREVVEAALAGFTGPLRQVPPQYSAVQIEGRRAYQLARRGEAVELAPRDVVVHEAVAARVGRDGPRSPDRDRRRRLLRRDLHPGAGPRPRGAPGLRRVPRCARPDRVGRVPARGRRLVRLAARARRRRARRGSPACSARSTPASRTSRTRRSPTTRCAACARA